MENFEINLIPQWSSLILQWVSTLILFLAIRHFLWKPMKIFLAKREELSIENLEKAKSLNNNAENNFDKSKQVLSDARKEAVEIVSDSKLAANKVHDSIIENAQKEVNILKRNNVEAIAREKQKFESSLKQQVIDISLEAAAKVVERELKENDHREFIENFVEKTY